MIAMTLLDLSKWDFAAEFMLYEAAALIAGIEPAEIVSSTKPAKDNSRIYEFHDHPQLRPVADRMRLDFLAACDLYSAFRQGRWGHEGRPPRPESVLRSREMEIVPVRTDIEDLPLDQATQDILDDWYASDECVMYETAKFTRLELSRWLRAIDMKSKYDFDKARATHNDGGSGDSKRWPWGSHHTELLGHLEAAAQRFWTSYDPNNRFTANTNTTVSEWLQEERKVSASMAKAIASILRADGLPTGPRT